jgi:hypothetical protein
VAITRIDGPEAAGTGAASSVTTSSTINAQTGDLVVVIGTACANSGISSIAWSGTPANIGALTQIILQNGTADGGAAVYAAIATGTVTNAAVVCTGAASNTDPAVQVRIYRGAKTSGTVTQAFGTTASAGTGTNRRLTLSTTTAGSVLVYGCGDFNTTSSPAYANDTSLFENAATGNGQSYFILEQTADADGSSNVAIGLTNTATSGQWGDAREEVGGEGGGLA